MEGLRDSVYRNDSIRWNEVNDSIPWLYQQHQVAAPSHLLNLQYAGFLIENKSTDHSKIDELLYSIDSLKSNTPARHLGLSFKYLVLFKYRNSNQTEKKILETEILDQFFILIDYCNGAIILNENEENETQKNSTYEWAKGYLTQYLVLVAKDAVLIEHKMQKEFDLLPIQPNERMLRITEHLDLMEKLNVQNQGVYVKYLYESLVLKPSSAGYFGMGKIEMNNEAYASALDLYLKALELSDSSDEQSDINYHLAIVYYRLKAYKKAFHFAKKIRGTNEGKAVLICGNAIAALANDCGESTFARKSNYWLANDYYRKAADLGEEVSRTQFLDLAPTLTECFTEGVTPGDVIELPCWNEKTKAR